MSTLTGKTVGVYKLTTYGAAEIARATDDPVLLAAVELGAKIFWCEEVAEGQGVPVPNGGKA